MRPDVLTSRISQYVDPLSIALERKLWNPLVTMLTQEVHIPDVDGEVKATVVGHEVHSNNPGVRFMVISGEHGDEKGAIETVVQLTKEVPHILKSGIFVAIPEAHPEAINNDTRNSPVALFQPEGDLNRNYTWDNPVNFIQKRAQTILRYLKGHYHDAKRQNAGKKLHLKYPAIVISAHTEDPITAEIDNDFNVVSYIRIDHTNDDELLGYLIKTAIVSGLPWVMEAPPGEYSENLDMASSAVLVRENIPSLVMEIGAGGGVDERDVKIGVEAFKNIMAHFEMIEKPPESNFLSLLPKIGDGKKALYISEAKVYTQTGENPPNLNPKGRLRLTNMKAGELVKKGQEIGTIENPDRPFEAPEKVFAASDGYVLALAPQAFHFGHDENNIAYYSAVELDGPIGDRINRIYKEQRQLLGLEQ